MKVEGAIILEAERDQQEWGERWGNELSEHSQWT